MMRRLHWLSPVQGEKDIYTLIHTHQHIHTHAHTHSHTLLGTNTHTLTHASLDYTAWALFSGAHIWKTSNHPFSFLLFFEENRRNVNGGKEKTKTEKTERQNVLGCIGIAVLSLCSVTFFRHESSLLVFGSSVIKTPSSPAVPCTCTQRPPSRGSLCGLDVVPPTMPAPSLVYRSLSLGLCMASSRATLTHTHPLRDSGRLGQPEFGGYVCEPALPPSHGSQGYRERRAALSPGPLPQAWKPIVTQRHRNLMRFGHFEPPYLTRPSSWSNRTGLDPETGGGRVGGRWREK